MAQESSGISVKREYKDRLFCALFSDKDAALSLYNAVNGTDYKDAGNLEIITLTDTIYMTMKNDVAICFNDGMNLWEQQSTWNPNMPLRGFMYFARSYEGWIAKNEKDIYSNTLIKIPAPEYYVLYNGTKEMPDQWDERLSDAFLKPAPGYEWTAHVLNINAGKNQGIMKKCPTLYGYAEFIEKIRVKQKSGLGIKETINAAIDESIEEGILAEYLIKHKAEVKHMILTEYNQALHEKTLREEGRVEGRAEGEGRFGKLNQILLKAKQYAELERASSDSGYREILFKRYGL